MPAPMWKEFAPQPLPAGWELREERQDGTLWIHPSKTQAVILSVNVEQDGLPWVHLSTSFSHRLPTWEELVAVRDAWLPNRRCFQVLAPPSEHVNIHKYTLHLWHCLGRDPVPDFTRGTGHI